MVRRAHTRCLLALICTIAHPPVARAESTGMAGTENAGADVLDPRRATEQTAAEDADAAMGIGALGMAIGVGGLLALGSDKPSHRTPGLVLLGTGLLVGPSAGRIAYGDGGGAVLWTAMRVGTATTFFLVARYGADDLYEAGALVLAGGVTVLCQGIADVVLTRQEIYRKRTRQLMITPTVQPSGAGLAVVGRF